MASANEVGGHTLDTDLIFEMLKTPCSLSPPPLPNQRKEKREEKASISIFFWLGSDGHQMQTT
jgi:hypothetical protein